MKETAYQTAVRVEYRWGNTLIMTLSKPTRRELAAELRREVHRCRANEDVESVTWGPTIRTDMEVLDRIEVYDDAREVIS